MILKPFDVNCLATAYSLISIMHQTEQEEKHTLKRETETQEEKKYMR